MSGVDLDPAAVAVVQEAAKVLLETMATHDKPVAYLTLEDRETNESSGVLMLCMSPNYVEAVVRFVHSLGNYHSEIAGPRS